LPHSFSPGSRRSFFGAAGAIGAALASEFAAQGASVFLAGRDLSGVERVAADIQWAGGNARAAELDALNEQQVTAYLDRVIREAGKIDAIANLIGPRPQDFSNGSNTLDLPLDQFMVPLTRLVPAQFITARAAARHMVQQRSGVILFVTALPSRGSANASAIGAAFGAMEALVRCLAVDLSPSSVRVVGIRSAAMIDTPTIQQSLDTLARHLALPKEQVVGRLEQATLLKRLPTAADTARLAALLSLGRGANHHGDDRECLERNHS
jgi:NAD(P)-dependent dehydrogenase (short-subunit alcohol dehydrogenase family)